MAEVFVSTILELLSRVAHDNARGEWSLVMGFEKEVERLESNLKAIQCELEDAEEKQFMNKRVQHWLDRFKQVSYDLEDVLDDWKAALDKLQTDGLETSSVSKRKVCTFGSCFSKEEGCWWILAQKAFFGRNGDRCKNVEDIGRKIANKCKGLLLAAKTLGCLLRDKLRREEWQNVLNSEIWQLDFEEDIFSTSLLRYYDLPSTARPCLLYCAMFPKDYDFFKNDLIQHWMALGYLKSDDNFGGELQGEDYFKCLVARSFFRDFKRDGDVNIRYCKMQDMVHDFVRFLTKHEFVIEEDVKDLRLDLSSKKPRHLRLVIPKSSGFPISINGSENLRSLLAVCHGFYFQTTSEALQNLFSQSKRLRLLEFDSFSLDANQIFPEIGNLIHLRYLSLIDCNDMEYVPEAVCELRNLQSLIIRGCSFLKKLPVGIGNLINLRYLSIVGCHGLTYYPKGIGNLTSLRTLHNIIVRADGNDAEEFSIGDLQHLDLLAGYLRVELVGNAIDGDEAKRAKLRNKIHLKGMYVIICSQRIKKEKEVVRRLVIERSKKTGMSTQRRRKK